jgi:hypothetical protein
LTVEHNVTAAWTKATTDQIEKRGLASAIGPNDGNALTRLDGQIDTTNDFSFTETFVKIFKFKCASHHAASLRLISFSMPV